LVGSANFYLAAKNSAAPADSIPFNEAWGNPWTYAGLSADGLTLQVDKKEKRHMVDEIDTPAVITIESTTMKVMFKFAEATLENMKAASGGGAIVTQQPGTGIIGKKTLTLSSNLEIVAVGFEGLNPQGFFRRIIIPRVVSVGKIKTEWDRSKNKQVYAAEFESICSAEEISIYDKTANAL
ncbi:MAG: hypothetical protein CYG60_07080, partial [Actinobacteria bacterium]